MRLLVLLKRSILLLRISSFRISSFGSNRFRVSVRVRVRVRVRLRVGVGVRIRIPLRSRRLRPTRFLIRVRFGV